MFKRIDRSVLDSYASQGGSEMVREMISFFQTSVPPRLDRFDQALAKNDLKDGKFVLHALKNSFLNMGADALATECQMLEDELAQLSSDSIGQRFSAIRQGAMEVQADLLHYSA